MPGLQRAGGAAARPAGAGGGARLRGVVPRWEQPIDAVWGAGRLPLVQGGERRLRAVKATDRLNAGLGSDTSGRQPATGRPPAFPCQGPAAVTAAVAPSRAPPRTRPGPAPRQGDIARPGEASSPLSEPPPRLVSGLDQGAGQCE
ncbi:hypothetical protein GCM10010286_15780 [Streptomyces toxytricini]|nr:hypothetical protein GCM10010286_15780 [Streptomyces toxytricini]